MNKANQLEHIAAAALSTYPIEYKSYTFFSKATSIVYQVQGLDGHDYALKILDNATSNIMDCEIEALMLTAVQHRANALTPKLIRNNQAQVFSLVNDVASDQQYRTMLSTWLPGKNLEGKENEDMFYQLGQLVAELHLSTYNIVLPAGLVAKQWDQVFYFRDEQAIYHDPKYSKVVNSKFKALMDEAIPLFDRELRQLYNPKQAQLLHGDLHPWNIKIHNDQLAVLDFEDIILGQPIHDLAILFSYYRKHKKFSYDFVRDTVLSGYESVTTLPLLDEHLIDILIMARTVNFLNYILMLDDDHSSFINKSLKELEVYLHQQ